MSGEIIGVLAHETGHIAGGHLARFRQQLANAQILSVIGMLAGAGAMAGAASSGDRVGGGGTGAMGIMLGGQELVRRNLLSYQRSEEQAADLAAILTALQDRGTEVAIVHRLRDGVVPGFPLEPGFGVIAADGRTPKPAYCALGAVRGSPC